MLDELRATEYARLDASGDVYLDYTGGSLYAAVAARRAPARCCARPSSATRTRSTRPRRPRPRSWSGRARPCCATSTRPRRVRVHLHPERHRRAAARRRGLSVRAAGPLPGDVRQPQLGQRHPRVRPREGRRDGVRAARGARSARRRRAARALPRRRAARRPQPVRLPGAVQLLRRQAPAGVDRAGPGAGLGRAARLPPRSCRRSRLDLSRLEAGLRRDLVLQDVRLPDRGRRAARPARGARAAAPPVVQRRHRGRRERAGRLVVPLSGHALFEDGTVNYLGIPAVEIGLRHIERIGIDTISRRVEALGTWLLEALQELRHSGRQPGDARLRAGDVGPPRRHDRLQLPAPGRPRGRRALRRHRRGRARHLRPDGMLLQPGRRRDRVLALARHADRAPSSPTG